MPAPEPVPAVVEADVLVVGGGPAGTWAAVAAAEAGASVVLADKGYCGTSGSAAAGGNNLWYLPPGPARAESIDRRTAQGGSLTDRGWMHRTVDETYRRIERLAEFGYPFPVDEDGRQRRGSLQGPQYLRTMRRAVHRRGVRILDHSPALELLVDADGAVGGAAGVHRQDGWRPWRVHAKATVLATGGCAFLSGAFGLNVDTGDGALFAAEAGAELSGMEFSNAYALSPAYGNHTKGLMMQFATYYDEGGTVIPADGLGGREVLARHVVAGGRVFARLDKAPAGLHAAMRTAQPNYFIPLDKAGIDPFTTPYEVRFVLEGTVRGTGGLRLVSADCATTVPGLFAAGDVATRELVTGGISGGGSHNAAWAISSGSWAGAGAARAGARRAGLGPLRPAGRAGLRPAGRPAGSAGTADVVAAVQGEVVPLERNYFRTGERLRGSLATLDDVWAAVTAGLGGGTAYDVLKARQAAAMAAHARWMYRAALARDESRAMHRRDDRQATDPGLARRLLTGGLDEVWTRYEPEDTAVAA
ncbi:FAD-binding protein [Dactylosporangium fulvum]|uniref:FAD-binding protein n=1 Tax=Dactylosporangium fulvum TaxID=53359 RepID=UPI0031D29DC4